MNRFLLSVSWQVLTTLETTNLECTIWRLTLAKALNARKKVNKIRESGEIKGKDNLSMTRPGPTGTEMSFIWASKCRPFPRASKLARRSSAFWINSLYHCRHLPCSNLTLPEQQVRLHSINISNTKAGYLKRVRHQWLQMIEPDDVRAPQILARKDHFSRPRE